MFQRLISHMPKKVKMRTLWTETHGFSLLELMMALGILAIGILAIVDMHMSTIQGNAIAVDLTESNLSAQTVIESFLPIGYTRLTNSSASTGDGYTVVNASTLNGIQSGGFATLANSIPSGFTVEFRVISQTDTNADGTDDLKKINVRVKDRNDEIRSNFTFLKGR